MARRRQALLAPGPLGARQAGRRDDRSGRVVVRAPVRLRRGRDPRRRWTIDALRAARRRARPERAAPADRRGARRARDRGRPAGKARRSRAHVEWPVVLEATFDEAFLRLPRRVIDTAMQAHQRYFPLGGNRFALVTAAASRSLTVPGYVRVLEGRLDDAAFTFDRDVAVGIHEMAGRLGQITFFEGGGNLAEKAERLVGIVDKLGGDEDARQAASLAKADQASELVREFPDARGRDRRRVRAARRPVGRRLHGNRGALPPGRSGRGAPTYRGGQDPLRRGQDRHADGLVRPRPPSDRLARPVRPAPGGDRPLPARRRRRRRDPAVAAR